MPYVPSISLLQLTDPSPSNGSSTPVTMDQTLSIPSIQSALSSAYPFLGPPLPSLLTRDMETGIMTLSLPDPIVYNSRQQQMALLPSPIHAPSALSPTIPSSILSICPNQGPQPLANIDRRLTSTIHEQVEDHFTSKTWPIPHILEPFQSSSSPPQLPSSWPPETTSSPVTLEAQANRRATSPVGDDNRSSFANTLASTLNAAFAGLSAEDSTLALQPGASVPLDNAPILDHGLNNNDAKTDSGGSSDTSLESRSDGMECNDDDEAHGEGHGNDDFTERGFHGPDFVDSDSDSPGVPPPGAENPDDDGQPEGRSAGHDYDPIEDFFNCSVDSNEDTNHNTENRNGDMSAEKPIERNPQGALLSRHGDIS